MISKFLKNYFKFCNFLQFFISPSIYCKVIPNTFDIFTRCITAHLSPTLNLQYASDIKVINHKNLHHRVRHQCRLDRTISTPNVPNYAEHLKQKSPSPRWKRSIDFSPRIFRIHTKLDICFCFLLAGKKKITEEKPQPLMVWRWHTVPLSGPFCPPTTTKGGDFSEVWLLLIFKVFLIVCFNLDSFF